VNALKRMIRSRHLMLFLWAKMVALICVQVYTVMQSWLVLDLTGSTQGRSDMPSFGPTARVKCPGRPRLPGHSPSAGSAP